MSAEQQADRQQAQDPQAQRRSGWLTMSSWLASLLYLPWGLGMVFVVYGVYYLFGIEVDSGDSLASQGVLGWLSIFGLAVALAAPSWLGATLAAMARRRGAGGLATAALLLNLLIGVAIVVFGAIIPA